MRLIALFSLPFILSSAVLENRALRLDFQEADASFRLTDKATGVHWTFNPPSLVLGDQHTAIARPQGGVSKSGEAVRFSSAPGIEFQIRLLASPAAVEYSFEPRTDIREVLLLNRSLPLPAGPENYYAVPHRMGILLPAEGDQAYSRRLPAYETGRGYSMAMFGAVQNGSALLAWWEDPYTDILVDYTATPRRELAAGLALRKSARSVRLRPLGRGGYVEIAKAYREIARQRGFLQSLEEKKRRNPGVERFFGSADFKPFAFMRRVPNTRWNKSPEERLDVNFTFEECAQLAEHYHNDLGIDRALLVLNGWINGGYDNRHPDVLPAAPEIGGDRGLMECSRRVRALKGWVFGLHDNYQGMYKDAPSWDEAAIMKNADGSLRGGGVWAGGLAYLICSRQSLGLAARPQNVPKVKELFSPDLYFSDTIFAAPPYECYDPRHPLTLADDIRHKRQLCDFMRNRVGLFGSEEGREWGVPHADYFEGLMSHRTRFQRPKDNDIVIPLFELVFADAIPLYAHQSDRPRPDNPAYILHHILYAEMPVYYFGNHRYWLDPAQDFKPAPASEARLVFAKGSRFSLIDQFIKNTYEVLSPLHRLTALMPMTDHRFLTPDRQVERTRFGTGVEITVNYGEKDYVMAQATLPQYGFLVESPKFQAFYARKYRAVKYAEPALIVVDGTASRTRFYRAFGDPRVEWKGKVVRLD